MTFTKAVDPLIDSVTRSFHIFPGFVCPFTLGDRLKDLKVTFSVELFCKTYFFELIHVTSL